MSGVWCTEGGVQGVMCGVWCAECGVQGVVCGVWCAECDVREVVCVAMLYSLQFILYVARTELQGIPLRSRSCVRTWRE